MVGPHKGLANAIFSHELMLDQSVEHLAETDVARTN